MPERTSTRIVLLCAAVMAIGALALLPRLLKDRAATTGTPVRLGAALTSVPLAPGQPRTCLHDITFDPATARAQLTLLQVPAGGARLRLSARAPGWDAHGDAALAPLREGARAVLVPLSPQPPRATVGELCLSVHGPAAIALAGTNDPRGLTRTMLYVAGQKQPAAPAVTLLEADQRDAFARVPQFVSRAAALSPAGPWLFWTLLVVLLVGVPWLVLAALRIALRADEDDDPVPER